jgi:hypothetical protein
VRLLAVVWDLVVSSLAVASFVDRVIVGFRWTRGLAVVFPFGQPGEDIEETQSLFAGDFGVLVVVAVADGDGDDAEGVGAGADVAVADTTVDRDFLDAHVRLFRFDLGCRWSTGSYGPWLSFDAWLVV